MTKYLIWLTTAHSNESRNIVKGNAPYFNQNQPIACIKALHGNFITGIKRGSIWNMLPKLVDVMNCI